jgi:hypothetical protein
MEVYIFISTTQASVRAFTSDMTGGNLPADLAPWRATNGGRPLAGGSDPVSQAVQRDGYFLVNAKDKDNTPSEHKAGQ